MAITGAVTLIRTDGAHWHVAVCSDPGMRALSVTYSANDLKLGDRAVLCGAFGRQGGRHVMLDPCPASAGIGRRQQDIAQGPEIFFHRSALLLSRA